MAGFTNAHFGTLWVSAVTTFAKFTHYLSCLNALELAFEKSIFLTIILGHEELEWFSLRTIPLAGFTDTHFGTLWVSTVTTFTNSKMFFHV